MTPIPKTAKIHNSNFLYFINHFQPPNFIRTLKNQPFLLVFKCIFLVFQKEKRSP